MEAFGRTVSKGKKGKKRKKEKEEKRKNWKKKRKERDEIVRRDIERHADTFYRDTGGGAWSTTIRNAVGITRLYQYLERFRESISPLVFALGILPFAMTSFALHLASSYICTYLLTRYISTHPGPSAHLILITLFPFPRKPFPPPPHLSLSLSSNVGNPWNLFSFRERSREKS